MLRRKGFYRFGQRGFEKRVAEQLQRLDCGWGEMRIAEWTCEGIPARRMGFGLDGGGFFFRYGVGIGANGKPSDEIFSKGDTV